MGKIYTTQDQLVLYIDTGSDLTEASSVLIDGTDPDGTALGSPMLTTIEDIVSGLVSYEVQSSDFDTAGTWILWVYINYDGGGTAWGEPFHLNIYDPGS